MPVKSSPARKENTMPRKKRTIEVAQKPKKPEGAGILTTYEELTRKAKLFAEGKYGLLVIAGPPGVAKSSILRRALEEVVGNDYCFIEANASAFGAYCKLWQYRNKLVLVDDADPLHEQPAGKRLLKQLGQTEQWKRLSWDSKATSGKRAPAPSEFTTSSKVCIVTNQWEYREGNVHTAAVEDRGLCYVFSPTTLEVHHHVSSWYWDQEVFDFIARHLPYLRRPSCRLYYKTWQVKEAGEDWQKFVLEHLYEEGDPEFRIIQLLADDSLGSNNMRARKFTAEGYGSRATFYRYLADLEERRGLEAVPHFRVQGKRPQDQPDPMAGGFAADINEDADDED
jgi:hypothetical protein